jgi:hypothetical protein
VSFPLDKAASDPVGEALAVLGKVVLDKLGSDRAVEAAEVLARVNLVKPAQAKLEQVKQPQQKRVSLVAEEADSDGVALVRVAAAVCQGRVFRDRGKEWGKGSLRARLRRTNRLKVARPMQAPFSMPGP